MCAGEVDAHRDGARCSVDDLAREARLPTAAGAREGNQAYRVERPLDLEHQLVAADQRGGSGDEPEAAGIRSGSGLELFLDATHQALRVVAPHRVIDRSGMPRCESAELVGELVRVGHWGAANEHGYHRSAGA